MEDLDGVMEKTQAITTEEEIWEKVSREDLETFYDFYLNIAVSIDEIIEDQDLEEETIETLMEMKQIISSLGEIPKTFKPASDVESFRQEVIKLQDKADKLSRD